MANTVEPTLPDEAGKKYARITKIYDFMHAQAEVKTASGLEQQGFDIEFLPDYNATVLVYVGSLTKIAIGLGKPRSGWVSNDMITLRHLGWVRMLGTGYYALVKEPNKSDFLEFIRRRRVVENIENIKDPRRVETRMQIAAVNRRIDEIHLTLQQIQLRLADLEAKSGRRGGISRTNASW